MQRDKRQKLAIIVGANIAAFRKAKGWNQIEFAERLGIGADPLSRMERGLVAPRFSRLELIARTLVCSVAELFMTQADRNHFQSRAPSYSSFDNWTKQEVIFLAKKIVELMKG